MSLALYGHPFSSYTQKALIALYENGTAFEFRCIGLDTPQHSADWLERWPLRKFPLLVDGECNIVETSIIIEYLELKYPGPVCLLPACPLLRPGSCQCRPLSGPTAPAPCRHSRPWP